MFRLPGISIESIKTNKSYSIVSFEAMDVLHERGEHWRRNSPYGGEAYNKSSKKVFPHALITLLL